MFSVDAYLRRIGWTGPVTVDAGCLARLHEAHILTVPFENLDIHRGREIVLDEERLFRKVVEERRGGFCYELNGAFSGLLRRLGFDVTLLSARVARKSGGFGPEFDHMALLVTAGGERWLADVGFGDSFRVPLRLDDAGEQADGDPRGTAFRVARDGEDLTLWRRTEEWNPEYRFSLVARELHEYGGMCRYHQTSSASSFTLKVVCSMATADGRMTLTGDTLIHTTAAGRTEQVIPAAEWDTTLRREFGVVLATSPLPVRDAGVS